MKGWFKNMESNYRITKEAWEEVISLDSEIERLEAKKKLYLNGWKKQLEEEGIMQKTLKNGMVTIGWKVTTQHRLNQKKLEADYKDLVESYKEDKECKSFIY